MRKIRVFWYATSAIRASSAVMELAVGGWGRVRESLREGKWEGAGRLSGGEEDGLGRRREGEGLVVWV